MCSLLGHKNVWPRFSWAACSFWLTPCSGLTGTPSNREAHPDLQTGSTDEATKLYWWRARLSHTWMRAKSPAGFPI